jgi:glycosyltransferase involved in cell wall biosynthesis
MRLSVIVLTHNTAPLIRQCLRSVSWADELIVLDSGSTDTTVGIARQFTHKVFSQPLISFAKQRNLGAKAAKGDWLLYLDADERATVSLRKEIEAAIESGRAAAYRLPRENYVLGRKVSHGGFWPDYVTRLFRTSDFTKWQGRIHESPQFSGTLGTLKEPLIHLAHRSIQEGVVKSARWTGMEAELFYRAGHPSVTWWRLLKVIIWEFGYRFLKLQGFRDGFVGFLEALIQAWNRFLVYAQLWEMQQKPAIPERYQQIEKKIHV